MTPRRFTPVRTGGAALVLKTGLGRAPAEVLKAEGNLPTYRDWPIPGDRVQSVETFPEWFVRQFQSPAQAQTALKLLDELYAASFSDILQEDEAFEAVLTAKGVKPAVRVLAIRALPQIKNHPKSSFPAIIKTLADDPDPQLKAAAETWLKGAKK